MSNSSLRIVFLDAATFGDASLERFTKTWDCTVHPLTQPAEVRQRIAGYPVVVTNKVVLDKIAISSPEAAGLKFIAEAATGTDNID
ncbi:MAG TPA: hydroxyacid dehydrogenase, partial [Candidatus Binatia bacterium]